MTYREWKKIKSNTTASTVRRLLTFERNYPDTVASYKRRLIKEGEKKTKIMGIEDNKERVRKIAENLNLFR